MATTVAQDNRSDGLTADPRPDRRWLRRLFGYLRRYPWLAVATAIGAGSLALNALSPLLIKAVVDDVDAGAGAATGWALAGLAALAVALFATTFLRRFSAGKLSLNVQHDLRQDVFAALQRLDGPGQDALRTGQVVSRANSDLQMVQGLLAMGPMALGQIGFVGLSLVLMLLLSPLLTVVALLLVPSVFYLIRQFRDQLLPATWTAQQAAADVADVVEENVTGVRVVKGFGQQEREIGRLRATAGRLYALRLRLARITARTSILGAATSLAQVVVLGLGGFLAVRGVIGLGTFVAFTVYLSSMVWPMRGITMLFVMGQQAAAAVDRVLEIVDLDAAIVDPPRPQPVPTGPLDVELADVSFGYSTEDSVLHGFSLAVPAGRTVAVIGPSGSGKSTLSLLLPRFYDPQHGSITVGGTDIRELALADLRGAVGVVFEEAFLFSASIGENIGYGRPDATDEEIRAAAVAAEADEFISALPDGYATVIGERGLTLSGGQRQRIALARAMLTDPRVLILDDATSAVDPATEAAIHATLHRITAERTTILIAHRRSTLSLADTIAVVEHGRVVDHGTADELQARCPLYRSLLGSGLAPDPGAALLPGPDGVTPQLWPAGDTDRARQHEASGGTARGGGGLMSGMATLPATPELLAKVERLPAADDAPVPDVEPAAGQRFSLRQVLRPVRGLLLVALALVGLDALATAAIPALLRGGIDHGVSTGRTSVVLWFALAAAVVVIGDYLVQRSQQVVMARAGESVLFGLRNREFTHLQRLGLDYYEREMAGRIMTRMTTDVDSLSSFLQTGMVTTVVALTTFAAVTGALLVMNASLAVVAFAVLPIVLVATLIFRSYSSKQYALAREQVAEVNADLQENVAGLRVAQALGRQDRNSSVFAAKSDKYRRVRMRAQTAIAVYFPFVAMLADLTTVLVLAVGAHRVTTGALSTGTLLAFVLYLGNFFQPIQQLSQVFDGYQQARVAVSRIGELLVTPVTVPVAAHPVTPPRLDGRVRLDEVSFRYAPDGSDVLRGVDLTFRPGETVAVVGATGAGKSTLVKLIARFYDVSAGRLLVDRWDVRDFDLPAYRRQLGVVPQEAHLFVGTVRDNIAYGRPDASDAEVEAAARSVGAVASIAELSHGFRHQIDERGRNLSAGQRQLISLARAELVQPRILLLDEATAALDPAAELTVLDATDRLARGRTTVVVAHRLTTASRADRIVVMSHGRVAEIGTHDELLARGGAYSDLYAEAGS